jgi:hypothetical protein
MCDRYGSITPDITDCIKILIFYPGQNEPPVAIGYIIHYLNVEKKPFGLILL